MITAEEMRLIYIKSKMNTDRIDDLIFNHLLLLKDQVSVGNSSVTVTTSRPLREKEEIYYFEKLALLGYVVTPLGRKSDEESSYKISL